MVTPWVTPRCEVWLLALLAAARTTDMVGRIGGDEFAVLLPETDVAQVPLVAERLQSHAARRRRPWA